MLSCASTGPDPFEGFNRKMASFNTGFDTVILKPAAQAYSKVLPAPVKTSVNNAFANLADPWTAMNQLLQGRVKLAANDTGRFVVNSTVGIGGLFDVATPLGMPRHQEDIEQTLGVWGVPQGPYIVLPMLGPSSGRGLVSQYFGIFGQDIAQPLRYVSNVPLRNSLFFTQLVSMRSGLLAMPAIPPQMDRYTLMRDFYLRGREQQVGL
ncbi:VacJ family lipoprotein [Gammaproteobacteria bacterium]|jgi:phospholipid-binding lipoprotein MlaA|nr:VacJ family lipoprotein [Gammaproteobacteria bacterium]MDC1219923.1 VacJ family lipoprotein [Gammaproteobacteria bacterium]